MTTIWPSIHEAIVNTAHEAQSPMVWNPYTHVLSRFAFGATPAMLAYVEEHGVAAWLSLQIDRGHRYSGYRGHADVYARTGMCRMTPRALTGYLDGQGKHGYWDAMDELTRATLGLQAFSGAQLYETLVDFFSNHLNVPNHTNMQWNLRPAYDRTVIREHVMGRFSDMLIASCKHPAMLNYLSLCDSTNVATNENYARELLEMHTVGLRYSQDDVTNVARMLTGHVIDADQMYAFDATAHATGPVTVLGFFSANATQSGGGVAGDALLRYLAAHPYTAQHIAYKMCVRYVSDAPSAALVSAVASAYLESGTEIVPMVRTILRSSEFWQSRGRKQRRPTENLVAAVRSIGNNVTDWDQALLTLHSMTTYLGNRPLDWPTPDGYPDVAESWRSSSAELQVWDYHLCFAGQYADGFAPGNLTGLYGTNQPATSGQAIDVLTRRLTGQRFEQPHRQALLTYLGDCETTPIAQSGLRTYFVYLVGLILHSPYHALR